MQVEGCSVRVASLVRKVKLGEKKPFLLEFLLPKFQLETPELEQKYLPTQGHERVSALGIQGENKINKRLLKFKSRTIDV